MTEEIDPEDDHIERRFMFLGDTKTLGHHQYVPVFFWDMIGLTGRLPELTEVPVAYN